jgi:hypothetical protein
MVVSGRTFLPCQHPLMDIRNHRFGIRNGRVGVNYQLGLEGQY